MVRALPIHWIHWRLDWRLNRCLGVWKKQWSERWRLFLEQLDRMKAGGLEAVNKAVKVLGVVTGADSGAV